MMSRDCKESAHHSVIFSVLGKVTKSDDMKVYFEAISVKKLFKWLERQRFAILKFQREFEWNTKRVLTLLNTIYEGFPVYQIIIVRSYKNKQWDLQHKLHVLPPFNAIQNKKIFIIIDGDQHFSFLHRLRLGKTVINLRGRKIRFGDIYYLIVKNEKRFFCPRRPDPEKHFRVSNILSDNWRDFFGSLCKDKLQNIKECRKRLLNYKFIFIFIETNELAKVCEIFMRISPQGMPVDKALLSQIKNHMISSGHKKVALQP